MTMRMTTSARRKKTINNIGGAAALTHDSPQITLRQRHAAILNKVMNRINYQKKLDEIIASLGGRRPRLLLHSCCAPCSSYCLEYLSRYFDITVLYYNPNISPESEFRKRAEEEARFISEFPAAAGVEMITDRYDPETFYAAVRGFEELPEGGERCFICYRLRLERTAEYAARHGFDLFCTTLSISPLKNCDKINEIGEELSTRYGVGFLPSDFKKRGGYLRSVELSHEYGLYRQNWCGCVFSRRKAVERSASGSDVKAASADKLTHE